jgi:hypothetical protein
MGKMMGKSKAGAQNQPPVPIAYVVRQLVGTTLGVLRHLVWTTLAPAERDHLVGGFLGSVS